MGSRSYRPKANLDFADFDPSHHSLQTDGPQHFLEASMQAGTDEEVFKTFSRHIDTCLGESLPKARMALSHLRNRFGKGRDISMGFLKEPIPLDARLP